MEVVLGILSGFSAGVLGGAFGVGGAIVSTPAVEVLLGAPPVIAVGTPLPAILPTTLTGAHAYHRAGQIDWRAAAWMAPPGVAGAAVGAALTRLIDPHALLLVTALLIAWQALRVGWGRPSGEAGPSLAEPTGRVLAATGLCAGLASGLLGIGGGVVLVPAMTSLMRMPLKRSIGTSLVVIAFMVIPGTVVHALLGHIDWAIFAWLSLGVVPGAALGSSWTIRARERTVRLTVGVFLLAVAIAYASLEILRLYSS